MLFSKLSITSNQINKSWLLLRKIVPKGKVNTRQSGAFLPPSQYDTRFPDRLRFGNLIRNNWEINPLLFVTSFALTMMVFSMMWACKNKVDVVFTSNSHRDIAHTMDLRRPTIHKLVTINQEYEPWPEMQEVLDKMTIAEKRLLARAQACAQLS